MTNTNKHLIFSDESGYNSENQFGCLAKISGTHHDTKELNQALKDILTKHEKEEIKFKEINNQKTKLIASDFLNHGFEFLNASKIKVHILVWDKKDSRHQVQNRSDIENLKRMYYHNIKALLKHWKINTIWDFYPDQMSAIDWENDIIKYIRNTDLAPKDSIQQQLFETFSSLRFPSYDKIKELNSKKFPIIQLADLYAGLVRTSRTESGSFMKWYYKSKHKHQQQLFDFEEELNISNSLRPKFEIMLHFKEKADKLKMGINLTENKYFKTFGQKTNISIWHYEPQGDYDKAPIKRKL